MKFLYWNSLQIKTRVCKPSRAAGQYIDKPLKKSCACQRRAARNYLDTHIPNKFRTQYAALKKSPHKNASGQNTGGKIEPPICATINAQKQPCGRKFPLSLHPFFAQAREEYLLELRPAPAPRRNPKSYCPESRGKLRRLRNSRIVNVQTVVVEFKLG